MPFDPYALGTPKGYCCRFRNILHPRIPRLTFLNPNAAVFEAAVGRVIASQHASGAAKMAN